MQSHGITLSFHREMTDSSREFVGPDSTAAATFESYPRFIKRGFENSEGFGIKRSTADSKHVPSPQTSGGQRFAWRKTTSDSPGSNADIGPCGLSTHSSYHGCGSYHDCAWWRRVLVGSPLWENRTVR